jgi:hypothetical protein
VDYQFSEVDSRKYKEFLEQTGKEKAAYDLFLKWKCLTDLYFLGSEILGLKHEHRNKKPLLDPVFHRWLAYVLSLDDDKLILVARGHLKSRWVKVRIIQDVLVNPNIRIGLYSITNEKAQSMLDDIKRGFATPLLLRLFPETVPVPGKRYANWTKCNANELTIRRDLEMGNPPEENQIEAYGVGSTITGKHFDRHYYDDIVDKDTVRTMSQIQKTRDWFSYSQAILEPGGSETVTGTFYHYSDLYNTAIKEEWYKDHVYIRPCRDNGKPVYTWFTNAALDKIKRKSGPYIWSCQYELNPVPREDLIFPPPQPTYKEKPEGEYVWYIAVDPAPTQHEHSDSIALVCAALDKKGTVWIEEASQFKLPGADLARILIQKHLLYHSIRIGIEFGLQQDLKYILENEKSKYEETTHKPLGWYIEEIPLTKKNKLERINWSFGSFVRSGKCFIKEDCYDLLRQMELITPNYEGHDDLVDACSMVFPLVDSYSFRYYTKMPEERGEIQLKTWFTIEEMFPVKKVVGFEDRFVKGN